MNNENEEPIKDWISAGGKVFEFIKAIGHEVNELGGSAIDMDRVLKEPDIPRAFAGLLMGSLSTVELEPMDIIRTSGRSDEVKAQAAMQLDSDRQRLEVVFLTDSTDVAVAALEGIKDQEKIFFWYQDLLPETKHRWMIAEKEKGIVELVFSKMREEDLLALYLCGDYCKHRVLPFIKDEALIKLIVNKVWGDTGCQYTLNRVLVNLNDDDYLAELWSRKDELPADAYDSLREFFLLRVEGVGLVQL